MIPADQLSILLILGYDELEEMRPRIEKESPVIFIVAVTRPILTAYN